MVFGERSIDVPRNGRRSRGPSPNPNGHLSDDSRETDESEQENVMRVGSPYQAKVPPYEPNAKYDCNDSLLVWAPHESLPECKVDEYTQLAKEKHGYNIEQALGMLFWHKHSVDLALADLANFTPFPDEWTVEDKVLFEQAFSFHGKSFHRIKQMLPDKSIPNLVKYYYSWKKTRSRTSLMDRQAQKFQHGRGDESDEEAATGGSDSDFDKPRENGHEASSGGGPNKHVNKPGPKSSQSLKHGLRNKRRPPRGMFLNYQDLVAVATGPEGQGDALLKALDAEIVMLKRKVRNNKQQLSLQKIHTEVNDSSGIDELRVEEAPFKINSKWTNEELLLAVQGVRKYGKNFSAIAEVIGNKLEGHVRSFFVSYRRRFNLDDVLAEYEAEYGKIETNEEEEKMERECEATEESLLADPAQPLPSTPAPCAPPPLLKQAPPLAAEVPPATAQMPPASAQIRSGASSSRPTPLVQPPPLIKPPTNHQPSTTG